MNPWNKLLLTEYESFLVEVAKKIVRAEIDKAVFEERRNDKDRDDAEREQAAKLYASTSDTVDDFYRISEIIREKIKDLKEVSKRG